jgi:hypothetical protein
MPSAAKVSDFYFCASRYFLSSASLCPYQGKYRTWNAVNAPPIKSAGIQLQSKPFHEAASQEGFIEYMDDVGSDGKPRTEQQRHLHIG